MLISAAAVAVVSVFSGCSLGASVDSLLSPPKLSNEQSDIYNALMKVVGKEINLIYPKGGEHRSAFIVTNIDDDPDSEAIVFYEITGAAGSESNIRINILDKVNGKWQSVYDHAGVGTAIEKVIFSPLGDSNSTNIIIGYSVISNEKILKIYSFSEGILSTLYTDYYGSMFVTDIDKNENKELVIIHQNSQDKQAFISFVSKQDNMAYESTRALMNPKTTDFVNIVSGYIGKDTPALFIDGLSGNQLSTEIIYMINDTLRNPVFSSTSELLKNTVRPTGYLCTDIDFDGIVEIPTLSLFPGYNTESPEQLYITNWNAFDNYSIVKKYSSYYSISDGYCFIIPSRWENVVTAKIDKATGELVFYKHQLDLANSLTELMRFSVSDKLESEAKTANGYILIKEKDNINYLVKVPENSDEPLVLTNTEIVNNFYLMT